MINRFLVALPEDAAGMVQGSPRKPGMVSNVPAEDNKKSRRKIGLSNGFIVIENKKMELKKAKGKNRTRS